MTPAPRPNEPPAADRDRARICDLLVESDTHMTAPRATADDEHPRDCCGSARFAENQAAAHRRESGIGIVRVASQNEAVDSTRSDRAASGDRAAEHDEIRRCIDRERVAIGIDIAIDGEAAGAGRPEYLRGGELVLIVERWSPFTMPPAPSVSVFP